MKSDTPGQKIVLNIHNIDQILIDFDNDHFNAKDGDEISFFSDDESQMD